MSLLIQAIVLGITLAMDALSISVSKALAAQKIKISNALRVAIVFGVFQAIMPLLGYLIGFSFYNLIKSYFNLVSFVILAFLGGKMIYEHFKNDDDSQNGIVTFKELMILGIATSIDALAAGFIFSKDNLIQVIISCLIIGIVTFIICTVGYICGGKIRKLIGDKGEVFGGIVLILLGLKFLIEYF